MARFSLSGEDEEDGPSNNRPHKRQRSIRRILVLEEEEEEEHVEEEDGEVNHCEDRDVEEDMEEELERNHIEEEGILNVDSSVVETQGRTSGFPHLDGQNGVDLAGSSKDGSISFTLVDPEVLDCSICYEPLTIPIYQCENGHIACASCCTKLRNICASCLLPIGYNRCRAMEKVVESVRVACQNVSYGCKETFSHSDKYRHEKNCNYIPCCCPLSGCNFIGSSKKLYKHFIDKHKDSKINFMFGSTLTVTLKSNDRFLVLQEAGTGVVFILNNSVGSLGNLVMLDCIAPPVQDEGEYCYGIVVKSHYSTLRFESYTRKIQERVAAPPPPSTDYFLVPHYHAGCREELTVDICIR